MASPRLQTTPARDDGAAEPVGPTPSSPRSDSPTFADLGVAPELCSALAANGITEPFPIQAATLPDSLDGRDVLGRGRTGSGKTLGFVLPMLTRFAASPRKRQARRPRGLILAPTRELATQIREAIDPLAKPLGIRATTIFGGVSAGAQIDALQKGVDIVVACPGRLEDLMGGGNVLLDQVEITVLDEADHMADLGFLPGVKRIMDRTPKDGQRLLFSATLDKGIDVLVRRYLHDPITHSVDSEQSPVSTMAHHVLHVRTDDRLPVLVDLTSAPGRTIVFARTKYRAKSLTKQLNANGVPAVEMHGNLAQNARTRNLAAFSSGKAAVLVATDIAARGIHVDDVSLVIHADPPVEHKAYLHRSGRTARAGNDGTVITIAVEGQRKEVIQLARKAGIKPTHTDVDPKHPLLEELVPGQRLRKDRGEVEAALASTRPEQPAQQRRKKPARSNDQRASGGPSERPAGSRNGRPGQAKSSGKAKSSRPKGHGQGGGNGSKPATAGSGRPSAPRRNRPKRAGQPAR